MVQFLSLIKRGFEVRFKCYQYIKKSTKCSISGLASGKCSAESKMIQNK